MRSIAGIVVVGCWLAGSVAAALEVGVGVADITPDVETFRVPMAGYGARLGAPSKGVHDRLHAWRRRTKRPLIEAFCAGGRVAE